MRIVYFSPDYAIRNGHPAYGGAPHYRCILPARALAKWGGHETYVSPTLIVHRETGYLTGQTAEMEIPDPDIFVIHSWAERGTEAIYRAREAGQIVIGDIDDLIWEIPEGHQAESLNSEEKNLENIWANFMACDALTVSTPYLKEWIEGRSILIERNPALPVYVVRNAIDLDAFTHNSMRDKVRTLGWSGNPLWRADDLSLLRPWLQDFLVAHKLKFVHVGALPHASIAPQLDIDPALLIERPFQTFEDYRPSNPLREIDIQLIPLLDCPFNRAKSALKGLESAAWGVPFVPNASLEYGEVFNMGCANDFIEIELGGAETQPPGFLPGMLSRQRRTVVLTQQVKYMRKQTIEKRWSDWLDVYREVATSRHSPLQFSPASE